MAEYFREYHGIYGKAAHIVQVVFPFDALYGIIYFIGVGCLKMFDRFQYTDSGAQAEIGAVHHGFVSGKRYHAPSDFDVRGSQFGEFLCQYFFQPLESLGDQLKFLVHS